MGTKTDSGEAETKIAPVVVELAEMEIGSAAVDAEKAPTVVTEIAVVTEFRGQPIPSWVLPLSMQICNDCREEECRAWWCHFDDVDTGLPCLPLIDNPPRLTQITFTWNNASLLI
ncbi:hypothetical protein Nepgr_029646 [Nepenthes gracilis]|uniref:Uncharacterized protein n=1 Tax=Nepenthes gracilis TaxID=150966 RepID=A0AAD3TEM2_NEPGR|nr:hypothetical protein Nepgr_029646 [Nepenthes gracilis]